MSTVFHLPARSMATLLASLALAACTAPGGTTGQSGAAMSGGQSGAATMSGAPAAQMKPGQMDMGAMCAMHRDLQKAPSEQHQAMMDEKMKGMTPEMRRQHMDMMRQHCR